MSNHHVRAVYHDRNSNNTRSLRVCSQGAAYCALTQAEPHEKMSGFAVYNRRGTNNDLVAVVGDQLGYHEANILAATLNTYLALGHTITEHVLEYAVRAAEQAVKNAADANGFQDIEADHSIDA